MVKNGQKWPKTEFLVIFGHFSPFVPAHGRPLDPISAFTNITIITGCCCNDIYGERATPGYYHPAVCLKMEFFVIFSHFSPFVPAYGRPVNPTFTKMLSLVAVS